MTNDGALFVTKDKVKHIAPILT